MAVNTAPNRSQSSPKSGPKTGDGRLDANPITTPSVESVTPNRPQRNRELNDRQKAFAFAWVKLRAEGRESFSEAARMAGYTGRLDTLSKTGKKLLNNPKVSALIAQLMKEALTTPPLVMKPRFRYIMGCAEVLSITTFLARATLDDVLDEQGSFDIEKARRTGGIHALKRIKSRAWKRTYKDGTVEEVVTHGVELRDRNASLELMGRHMDLWEQEDLELAKKRLLEMEIEAANSLPPKTATRLKDDNKVLGQRPSSIPVTASMTTGSEKEGSMRIRITKDRIRCPECPHLCLKLEDEFVYGDEFEDENLNICSDCNEALVAALPGDYFAKLATPLTTEVARNSSPDPSGPASQMSLFDAAIMANGELSDLEATEISDSTQ